MAKKSFYRESSMTTSSMQNLDNKRAIDEFNPIHFPDENETYKAPASKHASAKNLVRGRNQCLHFSEIPHPSTHIQSSKPDSAMT
ncbi:unnamed protein product [Hymenolepis diminuta]|uniref:Uncharacterized protein n=1 Tax=Hymenolepis diminuta TaxID=6216 RepID=A0A564YNY4_HYMDI|nr:unnamed protein product [Hymenolepis diminuta]